MVELTLTTSIVTDVTGFEGLAAEWDRLLERSAQHTYFLRWHWNWLWWSHFAPAGATLFLVCCRDEGGELIGLAPFYLHRRPLLSLIPIREIHLLGMGVPLRTSEYVDVFARRGAERAVAQAVAAALAGSSAWDQLYLHGVPADSGIGGHVLAALGVATRASVCDSAPYIDTSRGWNHYKQALGRSMRRNVEYYPRKLFQQHHCAFECTTSADAVRAAVDDLIRLHQARWRAAGEPGSFANPTVARFLHRAAQEAAADGHLRLWTLTVDGVTEAALIGFVDAGVLHYFQTGFNPALAKADLGTVMVALAVRDCCDDPAIRAFDFMGGAGYKMMWAREARRMVRHEAWRANPRTFAHRVWVRSWDAAARLYRAAAPTSLREARRCWHRQRRFNRARAIMAVMWPSSAWRSLPIDPPS